MGCSVFRAGHGLLYATPTRTHPDPTLFPNYVQNAQGLWLRYTEWWPRNNPSVAGVVFIVSGLGEHSGRYDSVALRLNKEGFACFSVDNQGAGGSEGVRLYVERFDHFVDDIKLFVEHIHKKYSELKGVPQILLGHSMGGLIASLLMMRDPAFFNGIVLSGPAFGITFGPQPGSCLRKMLTFFSKNLPKLSLQRLNAKQVSYNRPVVELVMQDPFYTNSNLRVRALDEFFSAQDRALEQIKTVKNGPPLLIVFGEDDKLCSVERAREFCRLASFGQREMRTYPHAGHEVLTEVKRENILNDVVAFMVNCCTAP